MDQELENCTVNQEIESNGEIINRAPFIIRTSTRIMAQLVGNMKKTTGRKVDDRLIDHAITAVSAAEHLWDVLDNMLMDDGLCNDCREKEVSKD